MTMGERLRNPNDKPQKISLDIGAVFELPKWAEQRYSLTSPWKEHENRKPVTVEAGTVHSFDMKPFEVLVFDAEVAR